MDNNTILDTKNVAETAKESYHITGTTASNSISENDLIDAMHKSLEIPDPPVNPMLRMKHISHLDLDGYGASILSEILMMFYPEGAMTLETANILPNRLTAEMEKTFEEIDNYDLIIITDLAVNQALVDMIKAHPHGNKVKVFDHHLCEIKDLPDNFTVTEQSPIYKTKLTCATELYYNFIKNDKVYTLIHEASVRKAIAYFVECVRVYDTFEFWSTRNDSSNEIDMSYFDAPRLNTLFHIMDRDEFKDYIKKYIYSTNWEYLTNSTTEYPWITKVLELEQNKNVKYVESAIRRMVRTPFKYTIYKNGKVHELDYNIGVIFAEKSSPVIANTALERNEDLDFCAVVSNNQVSIYANRDDINVSTIAKIFGGGGHKEAAGFTIPYINASVFNMQHFEKIIMCAGNLIPSQNIFEDQDVSDTN